MSHHQSVLKTQTWLKICLFLGFFLLFRIKIGELLRIIPVASLLQFRLCPSNTINNCTFVYPAHLDIAVNKHFSCDVEICCPSCLILVPLIEDTISTVITALSVWSGQISVWVCVPTEVCVCCGVCCQSGHACLQLLPSVETLKSTAMERCHGWDIHARPHILQRPWSGLDSPHMHVASIRRLRGRADAKTGITTPVGTSGARILGAAKAWLQLWLIAALSVCVFRDVPV